MGLANLHIRSEAAWNFAITTEHPMEVKLFLGINIHFKSTPAKPKQAAKQVELQKRKQNTLK